MTGERMRNVKRLLGPVVLVVLVLVLLVETYLLSSLSNRVAVTGGLDPRSPWVSVSATGTVPGWRLTNYVYQDETESGGNHNIYVTVVDERGAPVSGVYVHQVWPDGDVAQVTLGGVTNFGLYGGPFYPDRGEVGAYSIFIESRDRSDVVKGMGLPVNRHVNYILTFQRYSGVITPTPTTPGGVTPVPVTPTTDWQKVLHRLARALRIAADDLDKPE